MIASVLGVLTPRLYRHARPGAYSFNQAHCFPLNLESQSGMLLASEPRVSIRHAIAPEPRVSIRHAVAL